jgi:ABC-type proline/glycine betaine transport system permease subunit
LAEGHGHGLSLRHLGRIAMLIGMPVGILAAEREGLGRIVRA